MLKLRESRAVKSAESADAKIEKRAVPEVKLAASKPNRSGDTVDKQQKQGKEISKDGKQLPKARPGPKLASDGLETPLFFKLDEPFSILMGDREQAPLHLADPKFHIDSMELLGVDQVLRCETRSGPTRIIVSAITEARSSVGGPATKPVASFEASAGTTIRFAWDKDAKRRRRTGGHSESRARLRSQARVEGAGN